MGVTSSLLAKDQTETRHTKIEPLMYIDGNIDMEREKVYQLLEMDRCSLIRSRANMKHKLELCTWRSLL